MTGIQKAVSRLKEYLDNPSANPSNQAALTEGIQPVLDSLDGNSPIQDIITRLGSYMDNPQANLVYKAALANGIEKALDYIQSKEDLPPASQRVLR